MNAYRRFYYLIKIFSDFAIIIISFYAALILSEFRISRNWHFPVLTTIELLFLFVANISWYVFSRATGLYDEFRSRSRVFEIQAVFKNCVVLFFVAIIFIFVFRIEPIDRFFVFSFLSISLIGLVIWKSAFTMLLHHLRRRGKNLRFILLVGFSNTSLKFMDNLIEHPFLGYRIVGLIDDVDHSTDICTSYLGTLQDLGTVLQNEHVDEVIVAFDAAEEAKITSIVEICEQFPVMVRLIPGYHNFLGSRCSVSLFRDFPVITVRRNPLDEMQWRFVKRSFDIVFSICFLVLIASWLFPLLAILIKLGSPGPVFFKQERWGKKNKRIICYKFRSMIKEKTGEKQETFKQAVQSDPRITRIGSILRKTNMDELPQFLNVLLGEMSVVGPRPHPTPLNIQSSSEIDRYLLRHLVKPGITGWAQIHGYRGNTQDQELMQKRVHHDIWYIENWAFTLDLNIIMLTVLNMIKGEENAY
jgi:putative colanic acid biosynthesis UDP-glucose lipid carrier transferase